MRGKLAVWLLPLLVATTGWSQTKTAYDTEYANLEKQYQAAYAAWIKPMTDAKTEAEQEKVKLDFSKEPSKDFIPKFQALAMKAKGTDAGAQSELFVLRLAQQTGNEKSSKEALADLRKNYIESPRMEMLAQQLGYAYGVPPTELQAMLQDIIDKNPSRKAKAAAMLSLGMQISQTSNGDEKQSAKAKDLFIKLGKDYSDTPYAKRADGYVFQIDNLQIGKQAPDFECTDQDGKKFKLSDYRGKVVVIDFWGYW